MANPNPDQSGLTPFKKGSCPNPGGKTSEQRRNEIKAAEIAAKLRLRMLETLDAEGGAILEHLDPATLKLFKDSEDRAHGTPNQTINNTHDVTDPMVQLLEYVANGGKRIGD